MTQATAFLPDVSALKPSAMLTGGQIRAARALLKITTAQLAEAARMSYAAVQRAEGAEGVPNMQVRNLMAIKATLERSGVVFLDGRYDGDGGPGVRLARTP